MSKSQAPAPEGQPTHPTQLVVRGYPRGSPGYDDALAAHRTDLLHFVAKNEQYLSLSGLRSHRSQIKVPGATISYLNNEGQAQVVLQLEPGGGTPEEVVENPEFWQWALIEMTVPDMTKTSAELSAFMNPKPKNKVGVAWDNNINYDTKDPPIAYALGDGTKIATLTGQADQTSSLLVDMRPYRGGVKFDLYGYIHKYTDPTGQGAIYDSQKCAGLRAAAGAQTASWTSVNGSLHTTGVSAADISGRVYEGTAYYRSPIASQAQIQTEFPELVGKTFSGVSAGSFNFLFGGSGVYGTTVVNVPTYNGIQVTWTPGTGNMPRPTDVDATGLVTAAGGLYTETTTYYVGGGGTLIRKFTGKGAVTYSYNGGTGLFTDEGGAGPSDAMGTWGIACMDTIIYYISFRLPLIVYPKRDAPVRFAVFDGKRPAGFTELDGIAGGFISRYRWEDVKRGANRWKLRELPDKAHLISFDNPADTSIGNHFGHVKLGTVIINPRKGKGGIKFKAG